MDNYDNYDVQLEYDRPLNVGFEDEDSGYEDLDYEGVFS